MRITWSQVMLYPLTYCWHTGLLVHPQCTYNFMPQLPEKLSSAISPGPVTLINGVQCPLGNKVLLRLTLGSKTSTGSIKDSGLEGTPQLFRIPQSTQIPQILTQPVCKLLSLSSHPWACQHPAKAGMAPFSQIKVCDGKVIGPSTRLHRGRFQCSWRPLFLRHLLT